MHSKNVFAVCRSSDVFKVDKVLPLDFVQNIISSPKLSKKKFEIIVEEKPKENKTNSEIRSATHRAVKSGTWTKEEHERFLKAIHMYGNSWKKIQAYVGSRSCVQIRSHCQKYYDNIRKKAIEKSKETKENKLFAVYRTYRNTTYDLNTLNKICIESDIETFNCKPLSIKTPANDVDSNGFECEEEESLLDLVDSMALPDVQFLQENKGTISSEHYCEPISDDHYAQCYFGVNRADDSVFANEELELFNFEVRRKTSWHEEDIEAFTSTITRKIQYDI